jgi:hypothetical protein
MRGVFMQVYEMTSDPEASGGNTYETYGDPDKCRGDTAVGIRLDFGDLGTCRRWQIGRQSRFADLVVSGIEPGDPVV